MLPRKKPKSLKLFLFSSIGLLSAAVFIGFFFSSTPTKHKEEVLIQKKIQSQLDQRLQISAGLAEQIRHNQLPEKAHVKWDDKDQEASFRYTIEPTLQKEADRLLQSYKPDYGAIFMMDAMTGEVLAMSSFERDDNGAPNLNLQATFPAASIFKVVTATAAVDHAGIMPEYKIHYNGGAYTLYKKNVLSEKVTRWTNVITLKDAFARSINTAFGRLSIERIRPETLNEYANRFMFNQEIPADFPVEMGVAYIPPEGGYELAEAASGYNKTNCMSPVQGAMIAASVVNNGNIVVPYVVREMKGEDGQSLYLGNTLTNGTIMSKDSARKVRELMGQTVLAGTSRRSFQPLLRDRKYREIEMGGKTGHFTGDNPKGRVDWFIGYAFSDDRKVAIAAITVNKKFWTVKSAHLGQSMFRKYFDPNAVKNRAISSIQ